MPIFSHFDLQMAVSWVSLIKFQGNKCSQLCLTLCDPVDCSLPGSPVHRIFQARILEWGAMPSSRGSSRCRDQTCVSCIAGRFFSTGASLVAQKVKHLPAVQETQVWSLGWEDPLEEGMAVYFSILAWKILWTGEPGRLWSIGSQGVGHDRSNLAHTWYIWGLIILPKHTSYHLSLGVEYLFW